MIDIKLLANMCSIKKFSAGKLIIDENDKTNEEMFILLVGSVKAVKNYQTDDEIFVSKINPGNIFGQMSLFNNRDNGVSIIAIDEITVASITKRNFNSLAKKNVDVAIQMMEMVCERVYYANIEVARSNMEKTKIFETYNIDENEFYDSLLYMKGHGTYDKTRPQEFEKVLYEDTFVCPNCQKAFDAMVPLTSRLIQKGELTCDMRRNFNDFDPIWYDVVTCPHCYFSAIENMMKSDFTLNKQSYEDMLTLLNMRLKLDFTEPKTAQQVFASHYLALLCAEGYDNSKQLKSKYWRSLSWLYADFKDEKMELAATKNAYEATQKYFSESTLSEDASQITLMILGTLAGNLKEYNDAIRYLSDAARVQISKTAYRQIIENEISRLRDKKDREKNI